MRLALRLAFPALLLASGMLVWAQDKPADKPAEQRSTDEPVLKIDQGDVSIERQPETPEQAQIMELIKGLQADLQVLELAEMGSETRVNAEAGGCKVGLGENTNFLVKGVGAEETVVSVLDIELELDRGTVIEVEFGSLIVKLIRGSFTARPDPDALLRTSRAVLQAAKDAGAGAATEAAANAFVAIASANAAKAAIEALRAADTAAAGGDGGAGVTDAQAILARAVRDLTSAGAALREAGDDRASAAVTAALTAAKAVSTALEKQRTLIKQGATEAKIQAAAAEVAAASNDLAPVAFDLGDPILGAAIADNAVRAAIEKLVGAPARAATDKLAAVSEPKIKFVGANGELLTIDLKPGAEIAINLNANGEVEITPMGNVPIQITDASGKVVQTLTPTPADGEGDKNQQEDDTTATAKKKPQQENDNSQDLPPNGTVVGKAISEGFPPP